MPAPTPRFPILLSILAALVNGIIVNDTTNVDMLYAHLSKVMVKEGVSETQLVTKELNPSRQTMVNRDLMG